MKKILIATVLLISAGLLPSCKKVADVEVTASAFEQSMGSNMKDLGTAD